MKKLLTLVLALVMGCACTSLVACGGKQDVEVNPVNLPSYTLEEESIDASSIGSDFKVGFIYLHDPAESTYDRNFKAAADEVCSALGVTKIDRYPVDESTECYNTAVELVNEGCKLIFADSFGHQEYMLQAAQAFPEVQFCHATGTNAKEANLPNYHNAFASIYEGRFLAGIVAGMKINEMISKGKITADQAKMGYVGAYTYAEVISGYTSFYLGAKSVCPSVTMEVTFTGSWFDVTKEKNSAEKLINRGCVLISQHADSMGAPTACDEAGVPNVSYNGSTLASCSKSFLISSRINWAPYFKHIIYLTATERGDQIETDYVGTLKNGSVALTELNGDIIAEGTVDAVVAARTKLLNGTLKVFDTSTFTVGGENLPDGYAVEPYMGHEAIVAVSDGYFHESEYISAPYFALEVDGITRLDVNFG